MAYTTLGSIAWGSGPNITGSIAYDYQRNGVDMQYKVKITINTLPYSDSYFGYPIYASVSLDGTRKVNGHQIKAASPSVWDNALVYETGWLTVSNKLSGTTALSVNIYSGSGENRDKTYSYSLTVIPGVSTMTVPSSITLGSAATLAITPAVSGYTHTITYKFGARSGTIASKTSTTSVSWTPSLDLAQEITGATSGTGTLTLTTYDGSTKVGSIDYSFKGSIPSSVKPSVASLALSDTAGYQTTYRDYVQGKSRLKLKATATLAEGSTIKTYTYVVGGTTYTSSSSEKTVDLPKSGTITVVARVTDSRGRTSTDYSTSITVLPYNQPQISALSVIRCKSNGTPDNAGTYAKAVFSGSISPLNNLNTATWKVQYRKLDAIGWSDAPCTVSAKYAPTNVEKIVSGIAADSIYIFCISATDALTGEVTSVEVPVPVGYAFFRTNAAFNGLTFGKEEVKEETLSVAWDLEVDGQIKDGDGRLYALFRELNFASGSGHAVLGDLQICWGTGTITPSAANTSTTATVNFPRAFGAVPTVIVGLGAQPAIDRLLISCASAEASKWTVAISASNTTARRYYWVAIGKAAGEET